MRITFDPEADAMYIYLRDRPTKRTEEMGSDTMMDFDVKGELVGIELLGVSRRLSVASMKKLKATGTFGNLPIEILEHSKSVESAEA